MELRIIKTKNARCEMRRIAAIGIILVAAAMFIFGLVSLLNEEKKAESTFYGATMVMADEAYRG